MSEIAGVLDFTLGNFKDLGDPRAFKDFELLIQMNFRNQAAYLAYQKHQIHLDAKQKLGAF